MQFVTYQTEVWHTISHLMSSAPTLKLRVATAYRENLLTSVTKGTYLNFTALLVLRASLVFP